MPSPILLGRVWDSLHPNASPHRNGSMARTLPDGWEALEAAGAAPYEITTLRRLAAELPDDHAVFHGVHWTRLDHGSAERTFDDGGSPLPLT